MADCLAVDCGRQPPPPARAPRRYAGTELMAHDYDSLLRALLDRLSQQAPGWRDRSEADLGIALLELFAYAGDQLAHLQDRVALEGYLRTATQRESVRRLLRLVDATLDPGNAAAAVLQFAVDGSAPLFLPAGFAVGTAGADPVVFETGAGALLHVALSRIALAADAAAGAAQLQLAADLGGLLEPGTPLLLQHGRQRVFVHVASAVSGAVTTVTLQTPLPAPFPAAGTSVHGNLVDATHGATHTATFRGTGMPGQRLALELSPLVWRDDAGSPPVPALQVAVDGRSWRRVDDFIDSQPADPHLRLVTDNDGAVSVLFGDGDHGAAPAAGSTVAVRWRVGGGRAGEVGPDTLIAFDQRIAFALADQRIVAVRNPLASSGGRDLQPLDDARLVGPAGLRRQQRAVTAADHEAALAAMPTPPLQSRARFVFNGSWRTLVASVELPGRQPLAAVPGLRQALLAQLNAHRMAGLDVRIEDARWCPLHLSLRVQVHDAHFARDVRNAVVAALLGPAPAGAPLPFFAPGRLRFGQAVHLSDLYAVVTAVEGVQSVAVLRFKRLGDRHPDREAAGFIDVGALEVARCDNDAAAPGMGVLTVRTAGGKEG